MPSLQNSTDTSTASIDTASADTASADTATSADPDPKSTGPILVLDTASPTVSLALGSEGSLLATRTIDLRQSSERLLASIAEMLRQAGKHIGDLGGVVALRGPGSFTGLRVGLGTVIGLHQALGLRATAIPTLPVLAASVADRLGEGERWIAAVDALRGEWMAATFVRRPDGVMPVDTPRLWPSAELVDSGLAIASMGVEKLTDLEDGRRLLAPPLAPHGLLMATSSDWDPSHLVQPIYFRPPAVTPPKRAPRPGTAPGSPSSEPAAPESSAPGKAAASTSKARIELPLTAVRALQTG